MCEDDISYKHWTFDKHNVFFPTHRKIMNYKNGLFYNLYIVGYDITTSKVFLILLSY